MLSPAGAAEGQSLTSRGFAVPRTSNPAVTGSLWLSVPGIRFKHCELLINTHYAATRSHLMSHNPTSSAVLRPHLQVRTLRQEGLPSPRSHSQEVAAL